MTKRTPSFAMLVLSVARLSQRNCWRFGPVQSWVPRQVERMYTGQTTSQFCAAASSTRLSAMRKSRRTQ